MHHFEKVIESLLAIKFESVQVQQKELNWIGLYGQKIIPDFVVPEKFCFEVKYQDVSGSVDQKLVYAVEQIRRCHKMPTYLIVAGEGWSIGALKWLFAQSPDEIFLGAMNMNRFLKWLNNV
jgi:hypothetical protein